MRPAQWLEAGLIAQKGSNGIFGGNRDNAANSGSRNVNWNNVAWNSNWNTGLRAACDNSHTEYVCYGVRIRPAFFVVSPLLPPSGNK